MDPKKLPTLDPKLKEAYERVMSTTFTPAAPTPTPTTASPSTEQKTETPAPAAPAPQPVTVASPSSAHTAGSQLNVPKPTNSSTFVAGSTHSSGGSKISPVLLIVAGIIFFAVYTLFWLRFFNVSLPFLP